MNEKALAIYRTVHGDDHPKLAAVYSNLGVIYSKQAKHTAALVNYHSARARMLFFFLERVAAGEVLSVR